MATTTPTTDSDILQSLVFPFDEDLDPQAAQSLLQIRFDPKSTKRINQLLQKNLEKFVRMGKFIDVLQAKARRALKKAGHSG